MADTKQRVLIPIVGQGSIIHIIRTGLLEKISSTITPVIALSWHQPDLQQELEAKGYEVVRMPEYKVSAEYVYLRIKISLWYKVFSLKSPTNQILPAYTDMYKDQKAVKKRRMREALQLLAFKLWPGYINKLKAREAAMIKQEPAYATYTQWLQQLRVTSIFTVTPFLPEVELAGRILKEQGHKVLASIHSFDNITTRQWPSLTITWYGTTLTRKNWNASTLH